MFFLLFNYTGQYRGSSIPEDLQGHRTVLRDCIEQLTAIETSRASLVSHLREALQEQVLSHGIPLETKFNDVVIRSNSYFFIF